MICRPAALTLALAACGFASTTACAHSASDAYLTLTADAPSPSRNATMHGQWDIALRDLDFVMKLDDDGDGRVTWGEVRRHWSAIERYAYAHLDVGDDAGNPCVIKPTAAMIDDHPDGAYAALFFDVLCAHPPKKISLNYGLFFAIDPSHRGIFVMRNGSSIATSVLSPQNSKIDLGL